MKLYTKHLYTETGCIEGTLEINGSIVTDIKAGKERDAKDISQYQILPGLIDVHTHGMKHYASQSTSLKNYEGLTMAMASEGVSGFLVTAGEHNEQEFEELATIVKQIESGKTGAKILGIHMEGPFLNPQKKGAFMMEQIVPLDHARMKRYIEACHSHLRYVSYAPELDVDGTFLALLKQHQIRAGGVHTNATYAQYQKAIDAGLDASAHTGNGMSQIDRRDVGALGASLLSDSLYCEIICDMIHLSPQMIQLILRCKPADKIMMISDSGQLSGLPPGTYEIHKQTRIIQEDGKIVLKDGGIAGSSYSLFNDLRCMKQRLGLPLETLLPFVSLNPATFLGLQSQKGSIKIGKDADFIVLDENDTLIATFVEGNCVYRNSSYPFP